MDKFRRYANFFSHPTHAMASKKYIFIISHMRATSTLLSHILASHPQLCGHRELHAQYRNQLDLMKARANLFQEREQFSTADFMVDKVLHNRLQIDEDVFSELPKYIFLLRNPERTMVSMIKRHLQHNSENDIYKLEDYYLARLETMRKYWTSFKGEKVFLESETLVNAPDDVLPALTTFLELSSPLSKQYEVHSDTGKAGIGDMSENIKQGKVMKLKPLSQEDLAWLDRIDMAKIRNSYEKTQRLLAG